ncbi:hypothetical protein [Cognatiyoonia sp. IB215182]|uniref:hypothetical protein n=1 Tax=Cognatiyoonia sp. IB215182 TaxID=3097353 RepID=UPI002A1486E4|nr:hypothetical protein [Cognatiyoonia sp. IB215182]MDX8351991.1 hypothetical protein [Cognatiyoonia sp. IB215182]
MMRFVVSLILGLMATQVAAQEVVGRSVVEGRTVDLLDDGTWVYTEAIEGDCSAITPFLQFCGQTAGWSPTTIPNPDVIAAYRYDDRHYGQVISEELGARDGLTAALMRETVISNAAGVIGVRPQDIPVVDVYRSRAGNAGVETVVYTFTIDGLDVVYANGIYTSPNRTMQLVTFAVGQEFTDRHRALHDAFLSHMRISK